MRGLYSSKAEIRHKVFTEIAKMALDIGTKMNHIYTIANLIMPTIIYAEE